MAVGTPTLLNSTSTNTSTAKPSMSVTVGAGESVIALHGYRSGLTPDVTLDGASPDNETTVAVSPFSDYSVQIAYWHEPGAATYTLTGGVNFETGFLIAASVDGVDGTTPFSGEVTGNGGSISDTGAVNVTSESGDRVFMAIISSGASAAFTGDQTEIDEVLETGGSSPAAVMLQHADGAATVDIGSAISNGGQTAWVGVNLNAAATGGGGSPNSVKVTYWDPTDPSRPGA